MRGLLALLFFMAACGSQTAEPCTVDNSGFGSATIICPDGTTAEIHAGADGVDGEDGTDGTDNRIVASHFCTGGLELTPWTFVYQAVLMGAGDVFVYGAVQDDAIQVGATRYYAAAQVGATVAAVQFSGDVLGQDNSGWWNLEMDRATMYTTIINYDVDASGGSDTWIMPPSSCVSNVYP